MSKVPYQDVWRDGALIREGRRECVSRYEATRDALRERLEPGPSVLEIGGWDGYFTRRLTEDLGARCVSVDTRTPPDDDHQVQHRRLRVDADSVHALGNYDAVLALSVLHHMPDDWRRVYQGARRYCRWMVVEVPHPDEVVGPKLSSTMRRAREITRPLYDTVMADADSVLAETPPLDRPDLRRPTVIIRCAARGPVQDGTGQAASLVEHTTDDEWAPLGFVPYPGTLNVRIGQGARGWLRSFVDSGGVRGPRLGRWAWYVPVEANGYPCFGRFSKDRTTVELVAPVRLREHLGLSNGDQVTVRPR